MTMFDDKNRESISSHMKSRARQLRRTSTGPERLVWGLLRDRRFNNCKFRRQHPVGPSVVDFYCATARLAIELDGRSHDDCGAADIERQWYLEEVAGLKVFRVSNDDVLRDRESVIHGLMRALRLEIV